MCWYARGSKQPAAIWTLRVIQTMAVNYFNRGSLKSAIAEKRDYLALFDPPQRNKFLRLVMFDALDQWRAKYLRRRIEKNSVTRSPFNYKLDTKSPMVHRDKLIEMIGKGRISVTKPRGEKGFLPFRAKVALPFGHAVRPEIAKVFRIGGSGMLANEVQAVANWLRQAIINRAAGI